MGRRPLEGHSDGIITALGISGLKRWGTDLGALSAGEEGKTSQGEGTFGLRRAFQAAGVRTVIMSLWSIQASETVAIMADCYQSLSAGVRTAQALCDAASTQLRARRQLTGAAIQSSGERLSRSAAPAGRSDPIGSHREDCS